MMLSLVSVIILTALAFSGRVKDARYYVEQDDEKLKDERAVVRKSEVRTWIITLCIGVLSCPFGYAAGAALRHLNTMIFEDRRYFSPLELSIILPTFVGGVVLNYLVVQPAISLLLVELEYRFNMRLEMSGEDAEESGNEKADNGEAGNEDTKLIYDACPLTAHDSIRVIRLRRGQLDQELECTLAAVRLGEKPCYEALSYCWGRRASSRFIKIQPSSLSATARGGPASATTLAITDTLHDALIYLRNPRKERVLWVDQICIDQKDKNERSAQVKLMQDIYASAGCAVVWLRVGRPLLPAWLVPQKSELAEFFERIETSIEKLSRDDGLESDPGVGHESYQVRSKKALQDMSKDERARYGLPDDDDHDWTLFYGFFDAPWFSRVWVIQEVAWPKKVQVRYTNLAKSWEEFIRVMNFVESLNIGRLNTAHQAVSKFFSRLRALQACRESTQAGNLEPFDKVLSRHRMAAASDSRDHIYGLMGLASERPPMEPNYKEASGQDVFLETAKWAVREGCLDILGLCGNPSDPNRAKLRRRPKGLLPRKDPFPMPSWVPDFSDTAGPHSLTGMGMFLPPKVSSMTQFCASSGPATAPRIGQDNVMEILGHSIGKIQELSDGAAPGRDTHEIHKLRTTSQIEGPRLHLDESIREVLRLLNTKMAWEQMAKRLAAKNCVYEHTKESIEDAVLRTFLLGKTGDIPEELRLCYRAEQFALKIWRLLTFRQGCSSQLMGFVTIVLLLLVFRAAPEWLLRQYGYESQLSDTEGYSAGRKLSVEREFFSGTDDLIGLAPRWAKPGDEIFILQGGKVPMILRRYGSDGPYQFIGEAYVHGAMHGEMFDLQKCKKIPIA